MQTAFVELGRTPNAAGIRRLTIGRASCMLRKGLRRTFAKGEALFKEGEAVDCHYRVISGTFLASTLLKDGRRLIDAFHIPGAVLGLENCDVSSFAAEATEPVTVEVFRRLRSQVFWTAIDLPEGCADT